MLERKEFKTYSKPIIDWIQKYFNNIESYPVKSTSLPGSIYDQLPDLPPQHSEELAAILQDLDQIILQGITHWQHPNFHAYFTANSSVESVYAEMITAAIGAQCMIWETSPAAAELEEKMMDWLKDMMGLPNSWSGVIQDTASTATLASILTAREIKTGFRSNWDGVPPNLRCYCSEQTHSSIDKAIAISGIGRNNLIKIPVDDQGKMLVEKLDAKIKKDLADGFLPCAVISTVGTTGTVAIDPVKEISQVCNKYKVWHHIDAAYAGTAAILPEYRWIIEGLDQADSFVFNPHKWMFTNFDCTAYFVKDKESLIRTFEILPEYLKTPTRGIVNDYRDWGIPLGRRFRALKLWFVLRGFGIEGIRTRLRHHIRLSQVFSHYINEHPDLIHVTKPFLNFNCFRYYSDQLSDDELNQANQHLLQAIIESGKVYLSHTKVDGKYALRVVIGQTYVEEKHVDTLIQTIEEALSNVIGQ